MLYFYQHIPQYIDPIIFTVGSFSIRWYALSYIAGFLATYLVLIYRSRKGEFVQESSNLKTEEITIYKSQFSGLISDFLFVAFFSSIIGGRIGYVLFYNFSYYISNPLAIISPFENGNFTGIYGMSYHGALLGILLGSYVFLRIKKINFWKWADFVAPAVPVGYFFGRIGNFLNGELYGRVTDSSLGMYFTNSPLLLRYPSQILEAFFEGIILFAILWSIRNKNFFPGKIFSIYLLGYGFFRIFSEIFREPDPQIGLILGYFTLGQLMSLIMIIAGAVIFVSRKR